MDETVTNLNETEYPLLDAEPTTIPDSTYWPFALAFGIAFLFWGFLTSLIVSGVGFVCMIIALAGWISEMNHEKEELK
jgi:hypothetical protein